jgi:hypothetical protein
MDANPNNEVTSDGEVAKLTVEETTTATGTDNKSKKKKKKKAYDPAGRDAAGRRGSTFLSYKKPILRRRIRLDADGPQQTSMSFKDVQEELDRIPVNEKGEIDEDDLEQFAERIVRHKKEANRQQKFFLSAMGLSVLLVLVLFGMVFLAASLAKDTSVSKDGSLVATDKSGTPVIIQSDGGVRIKADTSPIHSIPARRARRLFRRMLSDTDEFEDGDTVALVDQNDVKSSFEAVVDRDVGVHVEFDYQGQQFDLKLDTDVMIKTEGEEISGYSIDNLHLKDNEEIHTVSVVCTDGSDQCDVVSGSHTTNMLVRKLQEAYRRKLAADFDDFTRKLVGSTADCRMGDVYLCGPDYRGKGVCALGSNFIPYQNTCGWCECSMAGHCAFDEYTGTRGKTAEERKQICQEEICGDCEVEDGDVLIEVAGYEYPMLKQGCRYCWCFSPYSSVQTKDHGTLLMKELQLGDSVLTLSGDYKKVMAFQTYSMPEPNKESIYLKIMTNTGNEIVMTPRHMIFLCEDRSYPVPASNINVGDCLVVVQDDNNGTTTTAVAETEATVVNIEQVLLSGGISPLTEEGTIIVDGIAASCYSNPLDERDTYVRFFGVTTPIHRHIFTHALATPVLYFCDRVSSIPCIGFWSDGDMASIPSKMPIDVWATYLHKIGFTQFVFVLITCMILRAILKGSRMMED